MITALLLDVDDTLVDTRAAMVAAGRAAAKALWPGVGEALHHAVGAHFHADPHGFFGQFADGSLDFASMRASRVADLVETFSLAPVADVQACFEMVYEPAFRENVRCFDDVAPLLAWATAARVPVGLLTNSAAHYTQLKLELCGLSDAFAVVVTRDTLGFGKPDPRAFHRACELLGSAPQETTYVGDHIEIDAIAAKDAGLYAVWLRRDQGDRLGARVAHAHGIPVVGSLKEVVALLG
ncbi:MAG: HAD family hydrolase [Dermatophilaceae bacterium]